jgi:alpha-galactosidase
LDRITAVELVAPADRDGFPPLPAWQKALPVSFCSDWCGEHADPQRETEARMLWSRENLFIRFRCRYREIYGYKGGNTRRDRLWERDVAEVFIQPDPDEPRHYREFEISPNGDWLDLDICRGEKAHLHCGLKSRVLVDPDSRIWTAEMAVPVGCLTASFNSSDVWRLNLFRIEGPEPHRFYSAWRPTHTPKPNFHVPERFGELHFF